MRLMNLLGDGRINAVAKHAHARSRFSPSLLMAALAVFTGLATPASAERWTSLNGQTTVEAQFVGMWGESVVLELPGPRRVTVNVDDLIAESRIQARRMGEEQDRRRAQMREQIIADAKEAAAPAPTPLPRPAAAPAYEPPQNSGGILERLEWMDQQNRNGHFLIAAFDSLPPSYQNDLERMVQTSVAKLDIQGTNRIIGSLHSFGDLVVTRQRWLFSYPRLAAIDDDSKEMLKSVLLSVGGMIRDGIDPEQLKLDQLATRPFRAWLLELDARLAPYMAALTDQMEYMGVQQSSYEVKTEKDGKATVEVTSGTNKATLSFVTVDGMWVPADSDQEKWSEMMKQWEDSLAATADGSLLGDAVAQAVPMAIEPILQPAIAAQSAREFHAAIDGWVALAGPMLAQMGDFNFGTGRSGSGYGDDYGMGMEGYEEDMMMDEDYEQEMGMEGYGR